MTDLLRQGATLTERSCPACTSPLFKLRKGDLWCAQCQKRVVVVKEGDSLTTATSLMLLISLESTLLRKIQEVERKIGEETEIEKLQGLGRTLTILLENLERIRKMKKK